MLIVTDSAKEKFTEILDAQEGADGLSVRIVPSQQQPNSLEFVIDQQREGDNIVENGDGRAIFVCQPDLAQVLNGVVLDFGQTDQGEGFSMSRPEGEGAEEEA